MSNAPFDDEVTLVHLDIETNGGADPPLSPEAVEHEVRRLIHRDKQREREVDGLTTAVDSLRAGNTEWQRHIKGSLRSITDKLHVLAMERVVRPTALAIGAMFLGGFSGYVLMHLLAK